MQQRIICILVISWKMAIIGAECPSEVTCPEYATCYLIYPTSDGWNYESQYGYYDAGSDVYESANCYKYLRVEEEEFMRSCINTQQVCEKEGGNITVLNSIDEYKQLTASVFDILPNWEDSAFSVHLGIQGFFMGCVTIKIQDRPWTTFDNIGITRTDCATTETVDTVVCEFTDLNTDICVVPSTEMTQTTPTIDTPTSSSTKNQSPVADKTTEQYTSYISMHPSNENQTKTDGGTNLVAVILPIVVIALIIISLNFLFIRLRRERGKHSGLSLGPNRHLPSTTGLPNEERHQDTTTVSYSDAVVVHENSTVSDHNRDRSEAYNLHYAKDLNSSTIVVNEVYAVPHKEAASKNNALVQNHEMLNAADMDEEAVKKSRLGGDLYAVPNKKSKAQKEETKQDVDEPYDTLDADDMQPVLEQHGKECDDAFDDALYVNANAHCLQDEDDVYNVLNAADMHSDRDNSGDVYDVPYKEKGECQQDHGEVYDMLNGAEVRSDNEYGKLNASDDMPPKDNMYSYVETAVSCGIVTVSPGEDHTYDKLQRSNKT